jgi:zona occludens toxin
MAVLLEGLQGSGKSYYATYMMLHEKDSYYRILTNIDGIKTTDKIKPLEFKKFTDEILLDCYNLQVGEDASFDDVIKLLQEKEILPENVSKDNRVLLVIDEAQNYFGKSVKLVPALVWFITQHRHLYIELYLITQKYTLLRDDYKLFNVTYQAFPPVKQFSRKKIKYKEFAGLPYPPTNFVKTFTLPKEQEVFDMYISGDKVESPSILKRFFLMFVGIAIFLVLIIFYFISNFAGKEDINEKVEKIVNAPKVTTVNKDDGIEKKLYTFVVWSDDYFYIRGLSDNEEFPIKLLTYIKDRYFLTVVDNIKMSDYRTVIYVICSLDLENFLQPNKEKNNNTSGFNNMSLVGGG